MNIGDVATLVKQDQRAIDRLERAILNLQTRGLALLLIDGTLYVCSRETYQKAFRTMPYGEHLELLELYPLIQPASGVVIDSGFPADLYL